MNGPALIVADGKQGLGNHGAQDRLGECQGVLLSYRWQFWKFFRVRTENIEFRHPTFDVDGVALRGEDHHVVRQFPYDLSK